MSEDITAGVGQHKKPRTDKFNKSEAILDGGVHRGGRKASISRFRSKVSWSSYWFPLIGNKVWKSSTSALTNWSSVLYNFMFYPNLLVKRCSCLDVSFFTAIHSTHSSLLLFKSDSKVFPSQRNVDWKTFTGSILVLLTTTSDMFKHKGPIALLVALLSSRVSPRRQNQNPLHSPSLCRYTRNLTLVSLFPQWRHWRNI